MRAGTVRWVQVGEARAAMSVPAVDHRTLSLGRLIPAPIELVFAALRRGAHLVHWWPTEHPVQWGHDLRPGGRYHARHPSCADGVHGTYTHVTPPHRLVLTWLRTDAAGDIWCDTMVAITCAEAGPNTLLQVEQTAFQTEAHRDAHATAWAHCLDRLTAELIPTS